MKREPRRAVYRTMADGSEDLVCCGFTSDVACLDFARAYVDQEASAHVHQLRGGDLGSHALVSKVMCRGLDAYPGYKAWWPASIAMLTVRRVPPPPTGVQVFDARTARGRRLRDARDRAGQSPWDNPRVQAMAKRFHWPAP